MLKSEVTRLLPEVTCAECWSVPLLLLQCVECWSVPSLLLQCGNVLSAAQSHWCCCNVLSSLLVMFQVQLFLTLAGLYRDMHMFRKSSFYSRIAAMQFVSPANQRQPFWLQCYNLLIRTLSGYHLSLDPKEMPTGWFIVSVTRYSAWVLIVNKHFMHAILS